MWLTLNLALIIQRLSRNYIYIYIYIWIFILVGCFHVPPGLRLPQVEEHWCIGLRSWKSAKALILNLALIIQRLSRNYIYIYLFIWMFILVGCFLVPPGVRLPQVEEHWYIGLRSWKSAKALILNLAQVIQRFSRNILPFNLTYPVRCLRVPPRVRIPRAEDHRSDLHTV
jgi:hypothetical protein